ncbi:hypothetical protein ACHAWO_000928 [Cyclotella atomus]|uniref:Uncharacterized protein n=1 Tax=Cyclotella atomus TaxID=382360 RepID=A0ABD3N379_9STRA
MLEGKKGGGKVFSRHASSLLSNHTTPSNNNTFSHSSNSVAEEERYAYPAEESDCTVFLLYGSAMAF